MAQQDYQSYLDQNPIRAAQESYKSSTGGVPWNPAVTPQESAAKKAEANRHKPSNVADTTAAAQAEAQYQQYVQQADKIDAGKNAAIAASDAKLNDVVKTAQDNFQKYTKPTTTDVTPVTEHKEENPKDETPSGWKPKDEITFDNGSQYYGDGNGAKWGETERNFYLNSAYEDEADEAYESTNGSGNQNAVATVYLDPNGKPQKGYIINGTTYTDPNGSNPVPTGSVVQDSSGRAWKKGENGSEMIYSPNEDDYWYYDDYADMVPGGSGFTTAGLNNTVYEDKGYYDANGEWHAPGEFDAWRNGNISSRAAGGYNVYDAKQNIVGYFDSAGNWHPNFTGDVSDSWEQTARKYFADNGITFSGNGKDFEGKIRGGYKDKNGWTTQNNATWTYNEALGKKTPYVYDPFSNIDIDYVMNGGNYTGGGSYSGGGIGGGQYPTGGMGNPGTSGGTNSQSYPGTPSPQATATSTLIDQIKQSNAEPNQNLEALNNLVEAYGTDTEGLRQRLQEEFGTPDLSAIREMLSQPGAELEFDYGPSDAYKQAEGIYQDVLNGDQPTLEFTTPERNYEDYSPTDYTEKINQIYDKKFTSAKTQIENQLAQGELDIDQAIAKVPAIYESGMNDMATQYEMNKRNANEYFAANGLTSGARAQAMLAMNNVYQQNMSAYRLEQAEKIQEYEDKRADLRLEAQSKITEAMLENDSERATALMQEYQRQDEYNFKFMLQKMDDDFKYWSQECDNAVKKATFEQEMAEFKADSALQIMKMEEDRRAENNKLKLQAAEYAENQRQFTITTGVDLAKIEEQIRQDGINTELTIAELAQKDGQFKINANMTIAELAEKIRQYGIDTDITLAKLAEQQREFDINAAQSAAELEEKIRQFNQNYSLSERELAQKQQQIDQNYDLSNRELQEKARQANMDFAATLAKTNSSKSTGGTKPYTGPDEDTLDELMGIATDILYAGEIYDPDHFEQSINPAELASSHINKFLEAHPDWNQNMVWQYLNAYGVK